MYEQKYEQKKDGVRNVHRSGDMETMIRDLCLVGGLCVPTSEETDTHRLYAISGERRVCLLSVELAHFRGHLGDDALHMLNQQVLPIFVVAKLRDHGN